MVARQPLVGVLVLTALALTAPASAQQGDGRLLVWADRRGTFTSVTETPKDFHCSLALSPDDRSLVVEVGPRRDGDLWLVDLADQSMTQLTYDEAGGYDPLFSPDGRFVYFSSNREGRWGLFRKKADGSGDEERVTRSDRLQIGSSISSDGRYLAYFQRQGDDDWGIWILPLDGVSPARQLFESSFAAVAPVFSPDGRQVAYQSNESGDLEVYVQSLVRPGGKVKVSPVGRHIPWGEPSKVLWNRDGLRLFSVSPDGTVWEVAVSGPAGALKPGPPRGSCSCYPRSRCSGRLEVAGQSAATASDSTSSGNSFSRSRIAGLGMWCTNHAGVHPVIF